MKFKKVLSLPFKGRVRVGMGSQLLPTLSAVIRGSNPVFENTTGQYSTGGGQVMKDGFIQTRHGSIH